MTPEQRLDRVERILILFVNAGRRTRGEWRERSREQDEKLDILIHSQMETTEQIKAIAARHDKDIAELRREHRLTERALRAFINSLHKGRNGEFSN